MNQRRANVTVNVFAEKSAIYVLDDNNETKVSVSLDVSPIKVFVGDASGDFVTYAEVIKLLNESDGVTTVHNAQRLGGYPADHYPRKAENALITGAWRHTGPLALGGNFLADAALHNEGDTILAGNVFLGSDLVSRGGAQAGFSGYGLWYRKEDNHLMIDNLTVRKAMRVYELIVNQIRGTNGSLWVSDTVKIVSAEETATTWRCFIDTNDASSIVPFREGDLIRSQRWTGKGVKYYSSKVVATATDFFELNKETWDGWDVPEAEDVIVRFGNVSDPNRQGALYLTSSDTDAPYMDVIDGVDSFNLAGKTKVRIGKLNGIFYNTEQLSGYGLYGENTFLTGKLLVGDLTKAGQYMEYENGQLNIRGRITVTGGNAATKADVDAVQVGGRNLARQTFATPTPVTFPQNGFEFPIAEAALSDLFKGGAFTASVIIDEITSLSSNLHIMISVRNANGSAHRQTFSTSYFTAQDSGKLTAHFSLPPIADPDDKYATIHLRTISVGSTSLVYRCMQLETGNRATDWTPAPEDVDADIATAQTAANSANTAVGNLSGYVDGAFKDGVIDAAEAKAIEKYKNSLSETKLSVDGSYTKLYNNAYLTGTPKSNLLAAKTALNTAYTNLVNSINTAIADGKTTAAEKSDVDSKFGLFNTALSTYRVRVEEANAAIQVAVEGAANAYTDNIEVGGRNLALNTNRGEMGWNWSTGAGNQTNQSIIEGGVNTWRVTKATSPTNDQWSFIRYNMLKLELFKPDTDYVITLMVKANHSGVTLRLGIMNTDTNNQIIPMTTADNATVFGEWVKLTFKRRSTSSFTVSQQGIYIHGMDDTVGRWYQFKDLCIQEGNKATPYEPAPEDVPSALDYLATAIQDGSTDIEGGLVSTNILKVKDTNGAVRGGISGLALDNIGFWAGGTYQDAISNDVNVIFRKDGSFSLAGGKISGTAAGTVTIDGSLITQHITTNYIEGLELNFTQGKIGGFDINADSIGKEVSSSNLFLSNNRFYLRESGSVGFDVRNSNPYVVDIRDQSFRTSAKVGMRIRISGSTTLNRALETYGEVLFMSYNGVYGIRINDDGIKKTTNGGQSWKSI